MIYVILGSMLQIFIEFFYKFFLGYWALSVCYGFDGINPRDLNN